MNKKILLLLIPFYIALSCSQPTTGTGSNDDEDTNSGQSYLKITVDPLVEGYYFQFDGYSADVSGELDTYYPIDEGTFNIAYAACTKVYLDGVYNYAVNNRIGHGEEFSIFIGAGKNLEDYVLQFYLDQDMPLANLQVNISNSSSDKYYTAYISYDTGTSIVTSSNSQ